MKKQLKIIGGVVLTTGLCTGLYLFSTTHIFPPHLHPTIAKNLSHKNPIYEANFEKESDLKKVRNLLNTSRTKNPLPYNGNIKNVNILPDTLTDTVALAQITGRRIDQNATNLNTPLTPKPIPLRIYTPAGTGPFPLIVFYHGGGWVIGNINTSDNLCKKNI